MGKIRSAVWTTQAKITLLAHASVFAHLLRAPGWRAVSFIWFDKRFAWSHVTQGKGTSAISSRFDSRIFEPSCGTISLHAAGILALELLEG